MVALADAPMFINVESLESQRGLVAPPGLSVPCVASPLGLDAGVAKPPGVFEPMKISTGGVEDLARENALLKQRLAEAEHTRLQMSVLQAREENARLVAVYQAQMAMASPALDYFGMSTPWSAPSHKRQASTGTASTTAATSTDVSDVDTLSCNEDAISITSDEPSNTARTTMIVQNIPNRYTRSMLLELFDAKGFNTAYDMVYLPTDFTTAVNFGYAFVNFESSEAAEKFAAAFQGFNEWACKSGKVCIVDWCAEQGGLDVLVKRYQNCPVMHESVPDEFKPALYKSGSRVAFPAPTKKLRKPRMSGGRAFA